MSMPQQPNRPLSDFFLAAAINLSPVCEVARILEKHPAAYAAFGGRKELLYTLFDIMALDDRFRTSGGKYFHAGETPEETAQLFTSIHIQQYREGVRPSIPTLTAHHLEDMGLAKESPHYHAAMLVAARAELCMAQEPAYHNKCHFEDVIAHMAAFLKKNNSLADKGTPHVYKFTPEEMATAMIAAIGHDIDHVGGKNQLPGQMPGSFDVYRLENQSFRAIAPLLAEAGLEPCAIGEIRSLIRSTSPDGPYGILKKIVQVQKASNATEWREIDPGNAFPELRALLDDPKLAARAAMLVDADLAASAYEGIVSNETMSAALTREWQNPDRLYKVLSGPKTGQLEDLCGSFARAGFILFVVGDGPISIAAQQLLGKNYESLKESVSTEVAAIKASMASQAGPNAS